MGVLGDKWTGVTGEETNGASEQRSVLFLPLTAHTTARRRALSRSHPFFFPSVLNKEEVGEGGRPMRGPVDNGKYLNGY